jgi:hypothetical protein
MFLTRAQGTLRTKLGNPQQLDVDVDEAADVETEKAPVIFFRGLCRKYLPCRSAVSVRPSAVNAPGTLQRHNEGE